MAVTDCQVIYIPLVDDEDVVDTAQLRDAKPLGVLRVVAPWAARAESCHEPCSAAIFSDVALEDDLALSFVARPGAWRRPDRRARRSRSRSPLSQ